MTLEKLAKQIFKECEADGEPITMNEALEMAQMELGAKEIKRYEQADTPKEKRKSTKKIDEEKKKIIEIVKKCLTDNGYDAIISIVDKTIDFEDMTITLTRHRKKRG